MFLINKVVTPHFIVKQRHLGVPFIHLSFFAPYKKFFVRGDTFENHFFIHFQKQKKAVRFAYLTALKNFFALKTLCGLSLIHISMCIRDSPSTAST